MEKYKMTPLTEESANKENSIASVKILGTGGAFDIKEKNSSFLINLRGERNFLVDCGYTTYAYLKENELVGDIDTVFITHTHDDHISGLSALIYDRWFLHQKKTEIICHENLEDTLYLYLISVCGHEDKEYSINSYLESDRKIDWDLPWIVDTTGYHVPKHRSRQLHTAGFVFPLDLEKRGGAYLIISGDINTPFIDVMKERSKPHYNKFVRKADDVLFFHDVAPYDFGEDNAHMFYEKLKETKEIFPNLFTYHHNYKQAWNMGSDINSLTYMGIKEFTINKQ